MNTAATIQLKEGEFGWIPFSRRRFKPIWIFKKHSLCYAQLYLFDKLTGLNAVVAYLVAYAIRKMNPQYVLLWDVSDNLRKDRGGVFRRPEFYGSLTEIRLYISRTGPNAEYSVNLICFLVVLEAILGGHIPT